MRRKDREITDKNEIRDIINRSKVIRIAFTGEEYPYVLPFTFIYTLPPKAKRTDF